MMSFLTSKAAPWLIAAMLMFGAAALAFSAIGTVQNIINDAVLMAASERDAHWTAEIEKANRIAAENIIDQMRISQAADLATRAEIDRLKTEISELESKNADLPDHDGSGIDVERTRLLNHRSIANYPN